MPSYARRSMSGSDCTKPKVCRFPGQHLSAKSKRLFEFIVEGEKRYWMHVAIDRFTGQVIGRQIEPIDLSACEVTEAVRNCLNRFRRRSSPVSFRAFPLRRNPLQFPYPSPPYRGV